MFRTVSRSLALSALVVPVLALAQAASIGGRITDAYGAPVPAAIISVDGGGQRWSAQSDEEGVYALRGLPAGTYTISVSAPGFASPRRSIRLAGGQATHNFTLRESAVHLEDMVVE